METRVAYGAVGLFVVLLGLALIGLALWMGSGITSPDYRLYSIYFSESVSGLYVNAPVRYRGVPVGEVRQLDIASNDPERVHVVVAIVEGTPIKVDTRAQLATQGVTGILNIELTGGTRDSLPLVSENEPPYPTIESTPSLFERLDNALTEGVATLSGLNDRVSQILSPENQAAISTILHNVAGVTATLNDNRERIDRSLEHAERMFEAGAQAADGLPETLSTFRTTLEEFQSLAQELEATSVRFRTLSESGETGIRDFTHVTLPQINALIGQMQALTENLTRLSEELREDPNSLIFGRELPPPGPGE